MKIPYHNKKIRADFETYLYATHQFFWSVLICPKSNREIAPWMPRGEYLLYMLLRLPMGMEPWSNSEQWLLGVNSFIIDN